MLMGLSFAFVFMFAEVFFPLLRHLRKVHPDFASRLPPVLVQLLHMEFLPLMLTSFVGAANLCVCWAHSCSLLFVAWEECAVQIKSKAE